MSGMGLPAGVKTQVAFCCDEFSEGGIVNTVGAEANIGIGAAGVYDTFCSLVYAAGDGVGAPFTINANDAGGNYDDVSPVPIPWASAPSGFNLVGGTKITKVVSAITNVRVDVTVSLTGTPGDSYEVFVRLDGSFAQSAAFVIIDINAAGYGTGNFTSVGSPGSYMEIVVEGSHFPHTAGLTNSQTSYSITDTTASGATIDGWLEVWDQNGNFVREVDHFVGATANGTIVMGGHHVFPANSQLRAFVSAPNGGSIAEGHLSATLAAQDTPVNDCASGSSGPGGFSSNTCSGSSTTGHVSSCCQSSADDGGMIVTGSGTGTVTVSATFTGDCTGDIAVTFDLEGPTSAMGSGTIPVGGGSFSIPGLSFAAGDYSVEVCFAGTGSTLGIDWNLSVG